MPVGSAPLINRLRSCIGRGCASSCCEGNEQSKISELMITCSGKQSGWHHSLEIVWCYCEQTLQQRIRNGNPEIGHTPPYAQEEKVRGTGIRDAVTAPVCRTIARTAVRQLRSSRHSLGIRSENLTLPPHFLLWGPVEHTR